MTTVQAPPIKELLDRAVAGEALTLEEGIRLYNEATFLELGQAADQIRRRLHPEGIVTFLVDRNINYTNVCIIDCGFCAFYRKPGSTEGYILTNDEIGQKVKELADWGGSRILLQGGVHPQLKMDFYEEMLHSIKEKFPDMQVDGFSPIEVWNIARLMEMPLADVLKRLHAAGMDGLPGGGAEILDNRTRQRISPHKGTWEDWIEAERLAQREGMTTSATMVFGFGEDLEERILHLVRLRDLQAESIAHNNNGFTSFICWSYQPDNTPMGGESSDGMEYLKMVAIARILLNNFKNISASWPSQGAKLAQTALYFGANDFGSTMMEENVVSAAGADVGQSMTVKDIQHQIRGAGFVAAKRDSNYSLLEVYR